MTKKTRKPAAKKTAPKVAPILPEVETVSQHVPTTVWAMEDVSNDCLTKIASIARLARASTRDPINVNIPDVDTALLTIAGLADEARDLLKELADEAEEMFKAAA